MRRLLDLAAQNHPEVAAARARVQVARGRLVQAGLYLNPVVHYIGEEIGSRENAAGFQGMQVNQEIVTARKIPLAEAAAAYGVEAFDWQAMTRWRDVQIRVRLAYYELLTAEREVEAARGLVEVTRQGLDAAEKLFRGGTGTRPDVLRARVAHEQAQARRDVALRRLEGAGRLLAAAVGLPALPVWPEPGKPGPATPLIVGSLDRPVPAFEWEKLREEVLARSSEVQEARALAAQAVKLLERARADAHPNVLLMARPMYSFPSRTPEVSVMIGAALPVFNANQGNILAAQGDVARTRAEADLVALRLVERLAAAYQRYLAARRQVAVYRGQVLPAAQEALRLIQVGYERGDPKYDYTALLQAQQTLVDARLLYVQALGELWRAASEIAGLLQLDPFGDEE